MARPTKYNENEGIYALVFDNGIKYIGQSKNIKKRYKQHCLLSNNRSNTRKNNFLRKKIKEGLLPKLEILEETSNLDEREIYWINRLQPELNTTKGGQYPTEIKETKKNKSWGNRWSPLQVRLNTLRDTLAYFERKGNKRKSNHISSIIDFYEEAIDYFGRDYLNSKFYERYGKT